MLPAHGNRPLHGGEQCVVKRLEWLNLTLPSQLQAYKVGVAIQAVQITWTKTHLIVQSDVNWNKYQLTSVHLGGCCLTLNKFTLESSCMHYTMYQLYYTLHSVVTAKNKGWCSNRVLSASTFTRLTSTLLTVFYDTRPAHINEHMTKRSFLILQSPSSTSTNGCILLPFLH